MRRKGPNDRLADRLDCDPHQLHVIPQQTLGQLLEEELAKEITLPELSPTTVPDYVSAVARAVRAGELSASRARSLLYAAQLMISAGTRKPPRRHLPQRQGEADD